MKAILFAVVAVMGSLQAHAGQSGVLSKTEIIEIKNPTQAFECHPGDGGFIFTTVTLNAFSIPGEFGTNFHRTNDILAYLPNKSGKAFSCQEAMKGIDEEIQKQGGQLKVSATRGVGRSAYFDGGCQLFLNENIQITVGALGLSGVKTFFITELPVASVSECYNLIPGKI